MIGVPDPVLGHGHQGGGRARAGAPRSTSAGRDPPLRPASRGLHGAEARRVPRRRCRRPRPARSAAAWSRPRAARQRHEPRRSTSRRRTPCSPRRAAPRCRGRGRAHRRGIREQVLRELRRRGAVVGLSGGIDSSVTAALCVRALGPASVPAACSCRRRIPTRTACASAALVADWLGIRPRRRGHRADARRRPAATGAATTPSAGSFPEYGAGWGCKVVLANALDRRRLQHHLRSWCSRPTGETRKLRMPPDVYLGIVAATNMKQRTRKQLEYYHADRLNYAVARHAEPARIRPGLLRQERRRRGRRQADRASLQDAGLPARRASRRAGGDPRAAADDRHLVAARRRRRSSTSRCPIAQMDLCLYGLDHGMPADAVARAAGLTAEQVAARLARHRRQAARHALSARSAAAGRAGARGLTPNSGREP